MRRALAGLLALVLGGCAQNAIFELHVDLPALSAAGTARFARVQVLPTSNAFGDEVLQFYTPAVALGTAAFGVMVSVPADGDEVRAGVHVKVQLCEDAACQRITNERWYAFDRVFYQARFTCYERDFAADLVDPMMTAMPHPTLGDPDSRAVRIEACEVTGCVSGTDLSPNNCGSDGHHFCESSGPTTAPACNLLRDRDVHL